MRIVVLIHQLAKRLGFFERSQILPLYILDERELDSFSVVNVALNTRELSEPRL